jgi:hypothetical protein
MPRTAPIPAGARNEGALAKSRGLHIQTPATFSVATYGQLSG